MKSIKDYIIESLLDDEDDLVNSNDAIIKSFIETNYKIIGSYTIKDNIVDVQGSVTVKNKNIESLTNGLFSFGKVRGDFNCYYCASLKSLEGAPKEVGRNFNCDNCPSLTSLEGAPKKIGGKFITK